MSDLLDLQDFLLLPAKSLRQTAEFKGNKMSWRYRRAKHQQATSLRHLMRLCLRVLLMDHNVHSWSEAPSSLAVEIRLRVEASSLRREEQE